MIDSAELATAPAERTQRRPWLRRHVVLMAAALSIIGVSIAAALYFSGADRSAIDHIIAAGKVRQDRASLITDLATTSIAGIVLTVIGITAWFVGRSAPVRWVLFYWAAIVAGQPVLQGLKIALGRARPRVYERDQFIGVDFFRGGSDYAAFPSGHSFDVAVLLTTLCLACPPIGKLLVPLGVVCAITRVFTLSHWPSDVAGGLTLGVITTLLLHEIIRNRFGPDTLPRLLPAED